MLRGQSQSLESVFKLQVLRKWNGLCVLDENTVFFVLLLDVPDLFKEGRKLFVLDLEREAQLRVHIAKCTQFNKC